MVHVNKQCQVNWQLILLISHIGISSFSVVHLGESNAVEQTPSYVISQPTTADVTIAAITTNLADDSNTSATGVSTTTHRSTVLPVILGCVGGSLLVLCVTMCVIGVRVRKRKRKRRVRRITMLGRYK